MRAIVSASSPVRVLVSRTYLISQRPDGYSQDSPRGAYIARARAGMLHKVTNANRFLTVPLAYRFSEQVGLLSKDKTSSLVRVKALQNLEPQRQ